MNILITGATGYIGGKLITELMNYENDLTLLVRKKSNLYNGINCIKADLNDKKLKEKLKDFKFDLVVHAAGYVPQKMEDDIKAKAYNGNVKATENLLRSINTKKFIFLSTCEIYGKQKTSIISEKNRPRPVSYYAQSKILAEKKCQKLCQRKNIDLCILRLTTTFGAGDKINRAIPNFFNAAIDNKDLVVFGNGKDMRDYLYIDEVVSAIAFVANNFRKGTYNLSSGKGISINDLARKIIKIFKSKSRIIHREEPTTGNLVFSNDKFRMLFSFDFKMSIETALRRLVDKDKIFLDLDGTLINIDGRWYALHADLSKKYEAKPIQKQKYLVMKKSGIPESEIMNKSDIKKDYLNKYLRERIEKIESKEYLKFDKLKNGARQFLKKLQLNYEIILLTNRKNRLDCLGELQKLKIFNFFDRLYTLRKYSKEQVLKLEKTNNSIYVGDTLDDYKLAVNLGVKPFILTDGARSRESMHGIGRVFLFNNLKEIIK